MMGDDGKKEIFANPPFLQPVQMQVARDDPVPRSFKNRCAFVHVTMQGLPPPDAFRPVSGLKPRMQLAGVVQEGKHGKARDLDR